jgi:DNA-binding NtrC family response regulator
MLQVLCAGRDPVLLGTRQLMLQRAGFATEVAIGTEAALAAFTARHFDVVVLCHTFTEQESHFLQAQLSEHLPSARVVSIEPPTRTQNYNPEVFLRIVAGR